MQSVAIASYVELEKIVTELITGDGWVVCYLDYKILIGKLVGGKMVFYKNEQFAPEFVQQLRVFNGEAEALFLRAGLGNFKCRVKTDSEQAEVYDAAEQVLWGTRLEELGDGWVSLVEDRGTELIMPCLDRISESGELVDRVKILTHNYIGFNEVGQAGYTDCRFVKFV